MTHWTAVKTPIDDLIVVATADAIVRIDFYNKSHEDIGEQKLTALLRTASSQLREYFSGKRTTFDLPVDQEGTDFQQNLWKLLECIPFGTTTTYGDLAKKIKNPLAARAVGMCCARNSIPIIIPCHRVTGTAGLTGFGGEIWRKKWLLKHEAEHSGLFR